MNAEAVASNIERAINPANACTCAVNLPIASVSTPSPDTVLVTLTRKDGEIPCAFAQFYVVSPTTLQTMSKAALALQPVGAGPFEVVSDVPNSKLVLRRNPHYGQKGRPHLTSLTFETTASDESAYEALQSGQAQAYKDVTTYSLLSSARQQLRVTAVPSALGTFVVQLNTKIAPFNNIEAREAIYYATNAAQSARA